MVSRDNITKCENFLNQMNLMLKDNETKVDICPHRQKNFIFYYLYNINEDYVRKVLGELTISDLRDVTLNTNPKYPSEDLYVFSKNVVLLNADSREVEEELYIKISIDEKGKIITTISFHPAEHCF